MEFRRDPQLERELYTRLREKYRTEKPLPHLTELLYCLTRSYFDRVDPLLPTDKELVYFAVGFGLEEVILRSKGAAAPESTQLDGIWLTPDYVRLTGGEMDLKSTRMYPGSDDGTPKMGWPDTWIEQFKSYAYRMALSAHGLVPATVPYSVGVVFIIPAQLVCGTFIFTREELEHQWEYNKMRRGVFMLHMEHRTIPQPFTWNKEWECRSCRYVLRCQEMAKQGGTASVTADTRVRAGV